MKKIAVLTSGGDAPGMNAAIRAVVRCAIYHGIQPYGIDRGFEGLINGELKEMNASSVSDILQRGGTVLKSARSERFLTEEGFHLALSMISNFEIDGLVVIGGNGSFCGGVKLAEANIPVIGLPGTIDNDLAYTDYTIGFDTAVNTVLSAIGNIRDTSSAHERSTVIQVMGRHCGDIALYAGLTGGAESILIPEDPLDIQAICRKLVQGRNRGKLHNIILLAEGVETSPEDLAQTLSERTGMETRVVVLGYIQRGGSPSAADRLLASRMGQKAIELLMDGSGRSRAVGISGGQIISCDLAEAAVGTCKSDPTLMELAEILSI